MVQSLINPAGAPWPYVSAGANPTERFVANWFNDRLNRDESLHEWEMYIRPYLNGATPSLVFLHPQRGIAVYEVVDWDPKVVRSVRIGVSGPDSLDSGYHLEFDGHRLEGLENPYLLVRHYKNKIASLSTDVLGAPGYGLITAGVIFTRGTTRDWERLLAPFRRKEESKSLYPVLGADVLASTNISRALPRAFRNTSRSAMTELVTKLLRVWLAPPDLPEYDADTLILDAAQSALVNRDPGSSGYRRIKGPAGSGKSVVLAARAAALATQGQRVLITCFNITLATYLWELVVRRLNNLVGDSATVDAIRRQVHVTHYHMWESEHPSCDCLNSGVCSCPPDEKFDAIMVDEGQDFEPEWWHHLRLCALANGAEVLFAADVTQDLYGRTKSWTDAAMRNSGFRGPWNTLDYSYRVPSALVPVLRDFANQFLSDRVVELPAVVQGELSDQYPVWLRWVQLPQDGHWMDVCGSELRRIRANLPDGHSLSDIALLFWNHLSGFSFASAVEAELPDEVAHIFVESCDEHGCDLDEKYGIHDRNACIQRRSRPLKISFPKYANGVRAITTNSYKGWESRHLVIHVQNLSSGIDGWSGAALFYVALTRLMRDAQGSSLTVVSSCSDLAEFGRRHFTDYEVVDHL